jgi:hypothetical protein
MAPAPELDFFGAEAVFHHAGIAVEAFSHAGEGLEATPDPVQRVMVSFAKVHGCLLEFIAPLEEAGPVTEMLRRNQHLYHLCFEVPDLEGAIAHAERRGFRSISRAAGAAAMDQRRIVWLLHRHLGLFELVEREHGPCIPS